MAVTQAELNNFHQFASARLSSDAVESMHELFDIWLLKNPPEQEQADTIAAIHEGLADVEAGRIHDFDKVNMDIRSQHSWPSPT